jgi:hypothetical protein
MGQEMTLSEALVRLAQEIVNVWHSASIGEADRAHIAGSWFAMLDEAFH